MPRLSSYVVCPRCKYKIQQHKHFTEQIKTDYAKAFSPWKPDDDEKLMELVAAQTPIPLICKELERQPSAIKRRIELLSYLPPAPKEEPKTAVDSWTAQEQADLKEISHVDKSDDRPRPRDTAASRQRTASAQQMGKTR